MIRNGKHPATGSRIAIVTPWFGADLRGGAELQSRQLAEHLAARGHSVDVLTTCCASFADDWERNSLRAGVERHEALTVRRFRTDPRSRRSFERVNAILLGLDPAKLHRSVPPVGDADAESFCRNGINSSDLYAYLAAEHTAYDRFIFIPYMFGTTLYGLPLVADRAYLQPCLHLEAYAFLPRVARAVHAARGLLFNSEGERAVAIGLYGPGIIGKSFVVGEGIDRPAASERPKRVGEFTPEDERYVLYVGRQDPAKNVSTLVAAFKSFRRSAPAAQLKLVFAGQRHASFADSGTGIVDLGPVSEAEKAVLLEHCRALAQPSTKESFSRVMYEAWMSGRPVLAHADCGPTADAVTRADGGFVAGPTIEWEEALHRIAGTSDESLAHLGRNGKAFAEEATRWDSVIDRYETAFRTAESTVARDPRARWDGMPDLPLLCALADGKTNLLYAGPVRSIEHLDELLVVFLHYLTIDREARLSIAATAGTDSAAYEILQTEVRRLDLVDRLLVTRDLATPQLQALYLAADVFISLDRSDHDAAHVRDAMWFDIPVLAVDTPAHRAVAGDAATLIGDTSDLLAVAVLAELSANDVRLRETMVSGQREKRVSSHAPA